MARARTAADDLDRHVMTEIKVEMMRVELERLHQTGEAQRFTVAELAARVEGLTAEQIGRRFRGESGVTLTDLEQLSEALGIEPWALLKAAVLRQRSAQGPTPPATAPPAESPIAESDEPAKSTARAESVQPLDEVREILAGAYRVLETAPLADAVEAAWTPTGPSREELTRRIAAYRGLGPAKA